MFGSGSGMSVSGAKAVAGVVGDGSEVSDGKPETCDGGIGICEEEDDDDAACSLAASA